jgi:hypothetical protein
MNYKEIEIRLETLTRISALKVTFFTDSGEAGFIFWHEGRTLKTVFTYRKAKIFAEGVAIGRGLC